MWSPRIVQLRSYVVNEFFSGAYHMAADRRLKSFNPPRSAETCELADDEAADEPDATEAYAADERGPLSVALARGGRLVLRLVVAPALAVGPHLLERTQGGACCHRELIQGFEFAHYRVDVAGDEAESASETAEVAGCVRISLSCQVTNRPSVDA